MGAMSGALSEAGASDEEETYEDKIIRLMESRRLLPNASYFAFTATPKEQDAGDIRRPGYAAGRQCRARRLPQLHHEAGDPGRVHSGCAQALHAGSQLLQARQNGGGRPEVRHQARSEKAAPASSKDTITPFA